MCECVCAHCVCTFRGRENTALNITVHLFIASPLEQLLLGQLWNDNMLLTLTLTEPDNSGPMYCSYTPLCCRFIQVHLIQDSSITVGHLHTLKTSCCCFSLHVNVPAGRKHRPDRSWQHHTLPASPVCKINWIKLWHLEEHQLTIGAPRRPIMSGRVLRLCRSMMQGQVNDSGAKHRARRSMMYITSTVNWRAKREEGNYSSLTQVCQTFKEKRNHYNRESSDNLRKCWKIY